MGSSLVVGTVASVVEVGCSVNGMVTGAGVVDGSDAAPFAFNTTVSYFLNMNALVGPTFLKIKIIKSNINS